MVPTPPLPPTLVYVIWTLAMLAGLIGILWKARRAFRKEVRELFAEAIHSEEFSTLLDKRVTAGFQGATGPLFSEIRGLAERVADAEKTAKKAHERMDRFKSRGGSR